MNSEARHWNPQALESAWEQILYVRIFECQHPVCFYRTENASLIPRAEKTHNCIIIWSTRDAQHSEHELKIPEIIHLLFIKKRRTSTWKCNTTHFHPLSFKTSHRLILKLTQISQHMHKTYMNTWPFELTPPVGVAWNANVLLLFCCKITKTLIWIIHLSNAGCHPFKEPLYMHVYKTKRRRKKWNLIYYFCMKIPTALCFRTNVISM